MHEALRAVSDPMGMLESIFAYAPFGLQVYSAVGQSLLVNRTFRAMFGSEPPPEYNVFKDEVLARAGILPLIRRGFAGELMRIPPLWYDPRELEHVEVTEAKRVAIETWVVPLFDSEHEVTHVAIVAKDVTSEMTSREALLREADARRAAEQARARLARLQQVTSGLARAVTPQAVAQVVLEQGLPALGISRGVLHLRTEDGQHLEMLGAIGFEPEQREFIKLMPLSPATPSADAVTSGEAQFIESPAVLQRQYPDLWQRVQSWGVAQLAAIPLLAGDVALGALTFDWQEARTLDEDDWAFAFALARQGTQALERARLYRETEQALRQAEDASRAKDEFLSVISHELRTPLNAMQGWAHLIVATKAENPSVVDRGLEVIVRNARAQATIIDDILDMARVITGKLRLSMQPTDLTAVVSAAVESVQPSATAKNIDVELRTEPEATVLADAERMQQVVWNLLSNAIKFTHEGGKVTVEMTRRGATVEISVSDSGIGIDQKDLHYLFDRFRQVDSSKTRAKGGLGLGLALVRQLVQAHGGQVRASSAGVGLGSTFCVEIPVHGSILPPAPRKTPSRVIEPPQAAAAVANLHGVRVLVVDDEPDAAEVLKLSLEAHGAEALVAHSAAEAFELATRSAPHIMVSDIAMPDEDGFSLLERLRAQPATAHMPAIALTAYARASDVEQALRVGYRQHVAKPVEPELIARLVADLAGEASSPVGDRAARSTKHP